MRIVLSIVLLLLLLLLEHLIPSLVHEFHVLVVLLLGRLGSVFGLVVGDARELEVLVHLKVFSRAKQLTWT
jgi:hypothetical protein